MQNNIPVEYINVEVKNVEISAEEAFDVVKNDINSDKKHLFSNATLKGKNYVKASVSTLSDKTKKSYNISIYDINLQDSINHWHVFINTNNNSGYEYIINADTGEIIMKMIYS